MTQGPDLYNSEQETEHARAGMYWLIGTLVIALLGCVVMWTVFPDTARKVVGIVANLANRIPRNDVQ